MDEPEEFGMKAKLYHLFSLTNYSRPPALVFGLNKLHEAEERPLSTQHPRARRLSTDLQPRRSRPPRQDSGNHTGSRKVFACLGLSGQSQVTKPINPRLVSKEATAQDFF